jgi:hypothetical protein
MAEVEGYSLAWHPQHGSEIRLKVEGRSWSRPIPVSAADLAAFAAIMQERPVQMNNKGWFHTGPEPVGNTDE